MTISKTNINRINNFEIDKLIKNLKLIFVQPLIEVFVGFKCKTIPLEFCLVGMITIILCSTFNFDYYLAKKLNLLFLYPNGIGWKFYQFFLLLFPMYLWGLWQTALRLKLIKILTLVFTEAGLKSVLNRLPSFVTDEALDEDSRKLTIKLKGQTLRQIKDCKDNLQEALKVHIDEIKGEVSKGTVEIIYSYEELLDDYPLNNFSLEKDNFLVGQGRTSRIESELPNVPHLLVAGQTGMGKSTFLRQLITSLYITNKRYTFELIDLKQGLEFQLFQNLPRIKVCDNVINAISILSDLATDIIEKRSKLLRFNNCKDIGTFLNLPSEERKYPEGMEKIKLDRQVVVIDEAFDLFMVGAYANAKQVAQARRNASKIAAQGRAVGIHIVVATQRPDKNAIDPQMKSNLTGKVCFRVSDIPTSNTILNNKLAYEIPDIKGRAIWKSSNEMKQVQTPHLSEKRANELLAKYRLKEDKSFNALEENKDV